MADKDDLAICSPPDTCTVPEPSSPGASPPRSGATSANYLKSYPYLFVRETDQTDYFCTICESNLKEEQLQSHLFDGHSAENLKDYFVRVCYENSNQSWFVQKKVLYICVVCWAKLDSLQDIHTHRESCKVSFGEDEEKDGDPVLDPRTEPTSVVSTPDIPSLMDDSHEGLNGHDRKNGSRALTPPFPQPQVILDTEPPQHVVNLPKYTVPWTPPAPANHTPRKSTKPPVFSSTCIQCSLCTMILPSKSYMNHLRSYHRVSCSLDNTACPLCMNQVPIMDLTVHLASQHGLVPQSAVNSLLLWVLTNNTFALTESAQASLKGKFKDQPRSASPSLAPPSLPIKAPPPPAPSILAPPPQPDIKQQLLAPKEEPLEPPLINDMRGKTPIEQIVGKFTRCHLGPGGKESHQCLVCSKWYAVPPIKHLRSHIFAFRQERRKVLQLMGGKHVCLICYREFDSQQGAAGHVSTHSQDGAPGLPGGGATANTGGLLAGALLGLQPYPPQQDPDDLPLGATYETSGLNPTPCRTMSPAPSWSGSTQDVELDNAGRVKSGKVRKQCELCGEWSNIKWFFKHMSEIHQALFCRCCREYLPIQEHKEHRAWHAMPPYMGQKIRIEEGQPIIIDRKERASLTPIGSLAAWGGSSGGLVVKAVEEGARKRKADSAAGSPASSVKSMSISGGSGDHYTMGMLPPDHPGRPDTLMPKERCPVCAIEITHKNLARHIKLRHGIKYKYCHRCRKLIPNQQYPEHRAKHESGGDAHIMDVDGVPVTDMTINEDEMNDDDTIEIPEEMLDKALGESSDSRKEESFRANTSMTKLESLMGKEFKHPRRKCGICGYSVSYSNFKRHLRNAHPGDAGNEEALKQENEQRENDEGGEMVGHHMDDNDRITDNASATSNPQTDLNDEGEDGYAECGICGDHVMTEFLTRHMRINHPEVTPANPPKPPKQTIVMRACPVCHVEMKYDTIVKHCKTKHKVSYRWCSTCSKYILKKFFRSHTRKHESGELPGEAPEQEEQDDLDTSREQDEEEQDSSAEDSKTPSKCYSCIECTKIFMSPEAHAAHMRDVHDQTNSHDDEDDDEAEDDTIEEINDDETKNGEEIGQLDGELVIDDDTV